MTIRRIRSSYYLLMGLFWFSTSLLVALYILYIMQKGIDLAQIGIWSGVSAFTVMALEIPTGGLADTWGRGRTFALANLVIAGSLIFLLASRSFGGLLVGAAFFGTGRALASGSLDAWFIDALKEADADVDIEKELGRAEALILALLAVGGFAGAALPMLAPIAALPASVSPLALPLIADASLKILLAVLTMVLIKDPDHHGSPWMALRKSFTSAAGLARTAVKTIGGSRTLPWLFAGGAAGALAVGPVEAYWQPRFRELPGGDAGTLAYGAVMAACFVAGALMSLVAPKVTQLFRGKRARTALLFNLLLAAALFLLATRSSLAGVALAMLAIYGFGQSVGVPRKAMLNDAVPAEARATLLSADSFISYSGFLGTVILGFLARAAGIPAAWLATALVVGGFSVVYIVVDRRTAADPVPEMVAAPVLAEEE